MRAYDFEYKLAKQDGAEFLWNVQPLRVIGKTKVEGMEFLRADAPGSTFTVACDRLIKAIGQSKQLTLVKSLGLDLTDDGRVAVEARTLRTSNPKVFAGGDAVNGGKEVVNAAADGKRAALGIWSALRPGQPVPPGNEYWVSTIDGRAVAPIPERKNHA